MSKLETDLALPAIKPDKQAVKITKFIADTFKKTGKKTAVVAVSGGVDSATTLALTVRALGPNHVHALLLPSNQTSTSHLNDAHHLSETLKLLSGHIHEINIGAIQDITTQSLKLYTKSTSISAKRLGNLAARIRMIVIFDQAQALDALVVGTENKSEHLLAYYTRFGDEASDLEPIKHLYKTQVYALAAHLDLPANFLTKAPSAGLWTNQTDESELGFSYQEADPILWQHFDKGKSAPQLVKLGFDKDLVHQILTHCQAVDFKHHVPYHL